MRNASWLKLLRRRSIFPKRRVYPSSRFTHCYWYYVWRRYFFFIWNAYFVLSTFNCNKNSQIINKEIRVSTTSVFQSASSQFDKHFSINRAVPLPHMKMIIIRYLATKRSSEESDFISSVFVFQEYREIHFSNQIRLLMCTSNHKMIILPRYCGKVMCF